jgi:7,8-dihydropterin-6-yl-methyl-4-(beta-D-ribofuranosyl)aminobenzene 5'-phosphate synthase
MTLANVDEVEAVLGGFHLVGKSAQAGLEHTVSYLKKTNPSLIVPAHCTGWQATHLLARSLPEAYACSGVGSRYVLRSA